jgi:DNA-binding response OmpR family regulator
MVILDIMMPEMNGYDLCREIRKKHDIPLIMLSAKDEEFDRILGLELGSDDYLTKPFSPRELTVRVKNIFKRISSYESKEIKGLETIRIKDITIKPRERSVYKDKIPIDITSKEYELLLLLCKRKNQAFSRDMIIDSIWGYEYIGDTRPVDDLVKRLRKKLKTAESTLEIKSVWGYGYKVME